MKSPTRSHAVIPAHWAALALPGVVYFPSIWVNKELFVRRIFAWYWLKAFIHTFRKTASAYFAHEVCFFPFIQQLRLLPAHDTILTSLKQRRENIGSLSKRALSNSVPELSATQRFWTWSYLISISNESWENFLGKKTPKWTHTALGTAVPEAASAGRCWRQSVATAFIGDLILYEVFIDFTAAKRKGHLRREAQISRCTNTAARGSLQPKRDKFLKSLGICTKVGVLVASHLNDPLMLLIMVH